MLQTAVRQHKRVFVILGILLGVVLIALSGLLIRGALNRSRSAAQGGEIVPMPQEPRVLQVSTGLDGDFPGNGSTTEQQKLFLEECVDFAALYGYNAILFEAAGYGQAYYVQEMRQNFDPLQYLTQLASAKNIAAVVYVNPFTFTHNAQEVSVMLGENPQFSSSLAAVRLQDAEEREKALEMIGEISGRYNVSAVVLEGLDEDAFGGIADSHQLLMDFLTASKSALHDPGTQSLGLLLEGEAILTVGETKLVSSALQKGLLSYVFPRISDRTPTPEVEALREELALWDALCQQNDATSIPLFSADDSGRLLELAGVVYQGAAAISDYSALSASAPVLPLTIKAVLDSPPAESTTLNLNTFPKTLSITRPDNGIVLDNSWEHYFIAGTSVPGEPIAVDGSFIEADPVSGLWGSLVELEIGVNTFTVQQGGEQKTISITRQESGASSTITTFRSGTLKPTANELVFYGDNLSLACTAPYGASVSASIGGLSVDLTPVSSASAGTPVSFTGTLDVSSLTKAERVDNLGQVSYTLRYNGSTDTRQSTGEVFAAGESAVAVGQVNNFGGMVNRNPVNDGDYISILRDGCIVQILENTGSYYGVSGGGYLLKDAIDLQAGAPEGENRLASVTLEKTDRGEKLHLTGSLRPVYQGEHTGNTLTFTLYNTTGSEALSWDALDSDLFTDLSVETGADATLTLTLTFADANALWGWDVAFTDNTLSLYLKMPPTIYWDSETPLSAVNIALDPGHGGSDIGAQGVPGSSGPAENLFNLANAYVLRTYLEALGANVTILQEDTDSSLNDRLRMAQQLDADFFVSIHHNSVSAIYDSNTVSGVEVYYWNDQSASFAQAIADSLTQRTGQKLRKVEQTYYRVTMMNSCPAVLVESGFLCNPAEYTALSTPQSHNRYAAAVTEAILRSLPQPVEVQAFEMSEA